MPNIKSAKKRVKVIAAKSEFNKAIKSDLKTALKKADAAVLRPFRAAVNPIIMISNIL